MTTPVSPIETDLADWLSKQPIWLQHAAQAILQKQSVEPEEIISYARLAIAEAQGELRPPEESPQVSAIGANTGGAVVLLSVSNISGIGSLNPQKPLCFGAEKLAVVYGSTGSGKSSYVRILKHVCGARDKGKIYPNVFDSTPFVQACRISFADGGITNTVDWTVGSGVLPALGSVDIFDTQCGNSYVTCEGEPAYEPRPLLFLFQLATLCDQVAGKFSDVIRGKTKALPVLPPEYANTNVGIWYETLTSETKHAAVEEKCNWTPDDEEEIAALGQYLGERSPKERAKELEAKKGFVEGIVSSLIEQATAFSDEACQALMILRQTAREKQQAAELAAKLNIKEAILDGIGTKQWLALWSIARTYSAEVAYPKEVFPHTGENSRCVLCQQQLQPEAKARLLSFEEYVAAKAAVAARVAKENLQKAVDGLPLPPDNETLEAKAASAGLSEASLLSLKALHVEFNSRRVLLVADDVVDQFGIYPETAHWITEAQILADGYASQAKGFLEGYNEEERTAKALRQKELAAKKWIGGQQPSIETELHRLKSVAILEKAKDLCGTRQISLKKGTLAEELITPGYIEAFNSELTRLGARRIAVTMVQTRVERGTLLHQVKLRNAVRDQPIQEILSEGEHRIVCIAAFLADVSSKPNGSTFVFDDPISSLDLDYEEAVVQRLVELSNTRQVIIFTHRLSLLGMAKEYATKTKTPIRVIHIRTEPWGAGEPGDESIEIAKPKAVLNQHLPVRISAAQAILEKEGRASYKIHAQSICTETRKLVERMIEVELLADVIHRHRRMIITKDKLNILTDIVREDCMLLDEMMTKYSRYEHAQSMEAPVELPLPEELLEDIAKLKKWRDDLELRRK
jgi:energy-coupling factor transporter ATP-binding protein EcfA2